MPEDGVVFTWDSARRIIDQTRAGESRFRNERPTGAERKDGAAPIVNLAKVTSLATTGGLYPGVWAHDDVATVAPVDHDTIWIHSLNGVVPTLDFYYLARFAGTLAADGKAVYTVEPTGFSGARVYNSGNLSITSGVTTDVTFDSEDYDTGGYHSTSVNTNLLTVPSDGYYHFGAQINFGGTAFALGIRTVLLYANNLPVAYVEVDAVEHDVSTNTNLNLSVDVRLTAGQAAKVKVFQSSGSNCALQGGSGFGISAWIHRMG